MQAEDELRAAVQQNPLPLAVVAVDTMEVVDMNDAARAVVRMAGVQRLPLEQILSPEDEMRAKQALNLVADGTLQAYEATRTLRRADGSTVECHIWVRSLAHLHADWALVVFAPGSDDGPLDVEDVELETPGARVESAPPATAIALIGLDTSITRISAESDEVLGVPSDALLGTPFVDLVHPDDVAAFLLSLGRAIEDRMGVGMRLRVRRGEEFIPVRVLVTPTDGPPNVRVGLLIAREMAGDAASDPRVAELEQHLWRIGLEVQASGVVHGMHAVPAADLPALSELTTRQWEIVTRLLRGERVPAIARALYVSQSTVRNHLAEIFRKFGVHSQAELLALLRDEPATPPA
jgi:DNA-binding CsgD family transcriptional regulator/PAS domain-containing protein